VLLARVQFLAIAKGPPCISCLNRVLLAPARIPILKVPMMRWRASLVLLLVVIAMFASAKTKKLPGTEARGYKAVVPLGIMKFTPNSEPRPMYLLVTAENPVFQNWQTSENQRMPRTTDGKRVNFFPAHIDFRVTASARSSELVGIDDYGINIPPGSLNDYMTKLKFRLAIFHGLDKRTVQPGSVENVGMPDDVSYDERVYRLGFDIGSQVPVEDRLVLEVLSPDGDRLGKFHLEF
jgi:hypothetical protein